MCRWTPLNTLLLWSYFTPVCFWTAVLTHPLALLIIYNSYGSHDALEVGIHHSNIAYQVDHAFFSLILFWKIEMDAKLSNIYFKKMLYNIMNVQKGSFWINATDSLQEIYVMNQLDRSKLQIRAVQKLDCSDHQRRLSGCAVAFVRVMKVITLHPSSRKVRPQMLSFILRNFALTESRLGLKELKCLSM